MFKGRLISEGIRDKTTSDKEGMDKIHNQLDIEK